MTRTERLERRYRRLLWAYPAGYRAERGDEIVGVLLDCAGPERSRPSVADAFDLTRAGLAARLRRPTPARRTPWRDALAVLTVVLPILLAAGALMQPLIQFDYRRMGAGATGDLRSWSLWMLDGWKAPVAWIVVVVLLLGHKPRLAFGAAVVATTLGTTHILRHAFPYDTPVTEVLDNLVVPFAATLLLSSSTRARRGVELVGRRGAQLAVVAACLMQLVPIAIAFTSTRIGVLPVEIGMGSNLMALVTLLAIATAIARRAGRDVARRVAVAGVGVAAFLLASLLVRWAHTSTPQHRGDFGIVVLVATAVPVAVVAIARRVPRLIRSPNGSAHGA